jgi:hypothetical protein
LGWFGRKEREARAAYRSYVQEGVSQGQRPELVGGGLIRSQGGWSQVVSRRKHEEQELGDERVLGSGDFVERVLAEAEGRIKSQFAPRDGEKKFRELIEAVCRNEGINPREMRSGSRRRTVSVARAILARRLVEDDGIPLAEAARHLGVTTSAVSKMLGGEKVIQRIQQRPLLGVDSLKGMIIF